MYVEVYTDVVFLYNYIVLYVTYSEAVATYSNKAKQLKGKEKLPITFVARCFSSPSLLFVVLSSFSCDNNHNSQLPPTKFV